MKIPQSLRLSLRELFLLVVVAAIGMGWYADRQRLLPQVQEWRQLLSLVEDLSEYEPPHSFGMVVDIRGCGQYIEVKPGEHDCPH